MNTFPNQYSLLELAELLGGQLRGEQNEDLIPTDYSFDSREVIKGSLFFAVNGANVDGAKFVPMALNGGAIGAVVESKIPDNLGSIIYVDKMVEALSGLGKTLRAKYEGPVVAITGSAGKTTAKALTCAALSPLGDVVASRGNRNTEFTSPLLWTEVTSDTSAVVVEMGMRGFGQIRHLQSIAKATVGVVTNIGHSHMSEVGSREGIAKAKGELLELLPKDGLAVLWKEDEYYPQLCSASNAKVATFGEDSRSDSYITQYIQNGFEGSTIEGICDGKKWSASLKIAGKHIALMASAAMLVASRLGVDLILAADAISTTEFEKMRMEIVKFHNVPVILDAYNASPTSMAASIKTLEESTVKGKKVAILGGMRELGEFELSSHEELGRLISKSNLDAIYCYGDVMTIVVDEAKKNGFSAISLIDSIQGLQDVIRGLSADDVVLIKGSRYYELERVMQDEH